MAILNSAREKTRGNESAHGASSQHQNTPASGNVPNADHPYAPGNSGTGNTRPQAPANRERAVNDQPTNHSSQQSSNKVTPFVKPKHQYKVYGRTAAMEIATSETRKGVPTVSFDFAPIIKKNDYNWNKKERFQMTEQELFRLIAVCLGLNYQEKFDFHDGKTLYVRWHKDGKNLMFMCAKGENKFQVTAMEKGDQMNILNACLYSMALKYNIPVAEVRMQIVALSREVAVPPE